MVLWDSIRYLESHNIILFEQLNQTTFKLKISSGSHWLLISCPAACGEGVRGPHGLGREQQQGHGGVDQNIRNASNKQREIMHSSHCDVINHALCGRGFE